MRANSRSAGDFLLGFKMVTDMFFKHKDVEAFEDDFVLICKKNLHANLFQICEVVLGMILDFLCL